MLCRGEWRRRGRVADGDLAAIEAVEAEEDARELGPSGAHQAEEAEHLAAAGA